ncbi:MAG: hypothetical protein ACR2JB_05435 [Bryobacteraceae bacterium]
MKQKLRFSQEFYGPIPMHAKITAKTGQRDALVEHLFEVSRLLTPLPGCELYVVNVVPSEPAPFRFSKLGAPKRITTPPSKWTMSGRRSTGQALIFGFASIRLVPIGGKGLPA